MLAPCPTWPTTPKRVGQRFSPVKYGLSDPPDLSDRKTEGGGENSIRLSDLATRWRTELDHDAAEAVAMAEHYAAAPGAPLPDHDPLRHGLLRGFHEHRARLPGP